MSGKDKQPTTSIISRCGDWIEEHRTPFSVVILILIIVSAGILLILNSEDEPVVSVQSQEKIATEAATKPVEMITVDISGAVIKPGVYTLAKESRIQDALEIAGGLSSEADADMIAKQINLAQKLNDGQKLYFPKISNQPDSNQPTPATNDSATIPSGPISLNNASKNALDSLSGIGDKRSQAIIDNRPYQSIEELVNRKIIPNSIFQKIKDQICL